MPNHMPREISSFIATARAALEHAGPSSTPIEQTDRDLQRSQAYSLLAIG